MGEREARGVGEAVGRAVHDLGHHGQRTHRARADTRGQQQLGKVGGAAIGGGGEIAVEPPDHDVARPDIVMGGHVEMREQGLRRRR